MPAYSKSIARIFLFHFDILSSCSNNTLSPFRSEIGRAHANHLDKALGSIILHRLIGGVASWSTNSGFEDARFFMCRAMPAPEYVSEEKKYKEPGSTEPGEPWKIIRDQGSDLSHNRDAVLSGNHPGLSWPTNSKISENLLTHHPQLPGVLEVLGRSSSSRR